MIEEVDRGEETVATPTIEERMSELLDRHSELAAENAALKTEIANNKILGELTQAARKLRVPECVIANDLERFLPDFCIQNGKTVLRHDGVSDVATVLKKLQSDRPHWNPTSQGSGIDPTNTTGFGTVSNSTWS